MSTQNSFRDWVCHAVRRILGHQSPPPPLLLWCDPDRSWLDPAAQAAKADNFDLWRRSRARQTCTNCSCVIGSIHRRALRSRVVPLHTQFDQLVQTFELEAEEIWEKSLMQASASTEWKFLATTKTTGWPAPRTRSRVVRQAQRHLEGTHAGNAKGTLVDDHRMLQALAGPPREFDSLGQEARV